MTEDEKLMHRALDAMLNFPDDISDEMFEAIRALKERLAQPEQDWDWRHPKAQALIGAKARLEIKLWLVEQLVEDPHFETTASDMEYWEPLHDKLQERLAQPEQKPVAWMYVNMDGECEQIEYLENEPLPADPSITPLYTGPQRREWVGLMYGVRVEGDTVVISVKGGNENARLLCAELLREKNA